MDWMEQEQERITITSAATIAQWNNHCVNIHRYTRHVDFTTEVQRSLRVLMVRLPFWTHNQVLSSNWVVFMSATEYGVPRIVSQQNGQTVLTLLCKHTYDRLQANAHPIQLPIGSGRWSVVLLTDQDESWNLY